MNMNVCVNKLNNNNCVVKKQHSFEPTFGRIEISSSKVSNSLKWINDNVASHHQRLILGATALSSQPFIDLHNKQVDERTRQVSVAKTLAKIISGTTTGFTVRYLCTKLAKNFTQVDETGKKAAKKSFLAPSVMKNFSKDRRVQYINALGAILGVVACLFTNFLIDAPLTKYLTNKFSARIADNRTEKGVDK